MVRFVIAIACVSLLSHSSVSAQSRTSEAKTPPGNRTPVARSTAPGETPVRAASRTQDSQQNAADAPGAGVQMNNAILNQQAPEMSPELNRELDRILEFWAAASDKIQRLEGKHFRIVYDTAFEVEKQSEGEFAYERLDKGRIDISPIPITPELIAARENEAVMAQKENRRCQVRLKKNGAPFVLAAEQPERWSCDGQRVYSMDMEKKEAIVAQLPADMQGKNIMDSPLPFLFGMPADKAKRRFNIFFTTGSFDPKSGRAYLTAYPRLPQDASTWRQADVILDLKEFLPIAVQMLDPASTKVTVYKFRDLKKNKTTFAGFLGRDTRTHFTPDLRDFHVQMVGDDKPAEIAGQGQPQGPPALVNVSGLKHDEAIKQLQRQGLVRIKDEKGNQIILEAGPPATRAADVYTVKSQDPEPGTPLTPGMQVKLTLWTETRAALNEKK